VINKDIFKAIGNKEMDRKGFLKYSGLVLLSIVGLKAFVSLLSQSDNRIINTLVSKKEATRGFGNGKYGA
jgi:hypothetical protein